MQHLSFSYFFYSHGNKGLCVLYSRASCLCPIQPRWVRLSLQTTKDVATQLAVPAPIRALMEAEGALTGTELGEQQTGTDQQTETGLTREVMLNKPD